jgi:hypothetical protein
MSKDKAKKLSEPDIDRIVAAQANDDSALEKPIRVRRRKSAALTIPANLAARAAFLARLHRTENVDDWFMCEPTGHRRLPFGRAVQVWRSYLSLPSLR